ncbi:MAG: (Fe-S)-binding protein [Acidimicrobiia bacterium]|nr:(Fe-S)-binding protein [Acidimicrobiia bacterium]
MKPLLGPTQTQLDACVTCGLCLPHCPTFRLTGDETASPRGRLTAMGAVADGVVEPDGTYAAMLSYCLQCRACEAACPSLVPFGQMMEGARAHLATVRPTTTGRIRRLLVGRLLNMKWLLALVTSFVGLIQKLGVMRLLPRRMRLARGLRRQRVFPHSAVGVHDLTPAVPAGSVALLAGCVMDQWFPAVHDATRGVLQMAGYEVDSPENQQCCGALAAHEGAEIDAARMAVRNTGAFAGYDFIVSDAAGCSAHLKDYGHWADGGNSVAERTRDVTEFVAELIASGQLPASKANRGQVAIHDPCHLRHAQGIIDAPRAIVRAAGYVPVEIDPDGLCCGAAGLYLVYEPDTAEWLGDRKAEQIRQAGPRTVVSANPGCEIQLRAHLGGSYRVIHPIELYWESLNR